MAHRYRIHEFLGQGAFGTVFRATETVKQIDVAFKVVSRACAILAVCLGAAAVTILVTDQVSLSGLMKEATKAEANLQNLSKEIWALRKLHHPFCVTMLEVIEDESVDCMCVHHVANRTDCRELCTGPIGNSACESAVGWHGTISVPSGLSSAYGSCGTH
jgi:serine/threonine protein kinase